MAPHALVDPKVVVIGPATWNHIITLDELPRAQPHMQFATDHWWTVGGTSAGKALHLADLGVAHALVASLGDDQAAHQVQSVLSRGGVTLVEMPTSPVTESHTNLMALSGERVSLYVDAPPIANPRGVQVALDAVGGASIVVLDLAETSASIAARGQQFEAEVWVDLHDWDGESQFQVPFVACADVVIASHERLPDIDAFLSECIEGGASLAIVTCGAAGSVGMDKSGRVQRWGICDVEVVDTNGAGDAFTAGAIAARLRGDDLQQILEAGSKQAVRALTSRHLCASLDM